MRQFITKTPKSINFALIGLLSWLPLLLMIPSKTAAQSSDSLRIDMVISEVLRHNDRLAASRYMEQAAYAKIGQAGAWDDPMLMAGVVNLPTSFDFKEDMMTMKMIGLSQNIPYAGQKHFQAKAARAEAQAATQDKWGMEINLVTAAKYAFFDLYYRDETIKELVRQHHLAEDILASTIARLKTDQANQADVAAAQAEQWRLESELLSARQESESARRTLYSLMGRLEMDSLPLALPPLSSIPPTSDEWLTFAENHYPPLQKLNRQAQSYEFSALAANRMRWPMLGLSATYGFRAGMSWGKPSDMVGFQANLTLPIFSGWQQKNMASSMQSMKKSVEAESSQLRKDIDAAIETLHSRALRLVESLRLYRERIMPADEQAYQSGLAGYGANRIPFSSLLSYGQAIYRDRLTANQIANVLARTMAEIERYTTDPDSLNNIAGK